MQIIHIYFCFIFCMYIFCQIVVHALAPFQTSDAVDSTLWSKGEPWLVGAVHHPGPSICPEAHQLGLPQPLHLSSSNPSTFQHLFVLVTYRFITIISINPTLKWIMDTTWPRLHQICIYTFCVVIVFQVFMWEYSTVLSGFLRSAVPCMLIFFFCIFVLWQWFALIIFYTFL